MIFVFRVLSFFIFCGEKKMTDDEKMFEAKYQSMAVAQGLRTKAVLFLRKYQRENGPR